MTRLCVVAEIEASGYVRVFATLSVHVAVCLEMSVCNAALGLLEKATAFGDNVG